MSFARLSASGLERAERCPAAYALPEGARADDDAAARGRAIHAFLERCALGERDAALADAPADLRPLCAAIDVRWMAGARLEPEVAFAYDPHTDAARCLGRIDHRAYREVPADHLPCTTDGLSRRPSPLVLDYKTGFESAPRAATSAQLQLQALCASRALGEATVDGAIVRVDGEGGLHWDRVTFDALDLDAIASRVAAVAALVAAARVRLPVARPGGHCRWCPAKPNCPAWGAAAAELATAEADGWLDRARRELDDAAAAGRWYERWQRASEVLEAIGRLVKERAAQGPLPLPDGRVLRASQSRRTSLHAETLLALLAEHVGGRDAALALATARGAVRATTFPVFRAQGPAPHRVTTTTAASAAETETGP